MKKVCSLFLFVALIFAWAMGVNATSGATLSGPDGVSAGETVELILSVSGCPDATSASVSVSYGDGFELVSGTWLKTGAITHYDTEKDKGAVAGLDSPDINGDLFKLVLKAKTASADAQTVSVVTTAKNSADEVMNITVNKLITITCDAHTYDAWSVIDDHSHQGTCSGCGEKSAVAPHQPGNPATETTSQICSLCGYEIEPALDTPETTNPATEAPQTDIHETSNEETGIEETGIEETVPVFDTEQSVRDFPWWIIIVAAVLVLGAAVLIVIKKKQ